MQKLWCNVSCARKDFLQYKLVSKKPELEFAADYNEWPLRNGRLLVSALESNRWRDYSYTSLHEININFMLYIILNVRLYSTWMSIGKDWTECINLGINFIDRHYKSFCWSACFKVIKINQTWDNTHIIKSAWH